MFFSLMELTLETYESTSIITGPARKHKLRIKMQYNIPSSQVYNFTCCYFLAVCWFIRSTNVYREYFMESAGVRYLRTSC